MKKVFIAIALVLALSTAVQAAGFEQVSVTSAVAVPFTAAKIHQSTYVFAISAYCNTSTAIHFTVDGMVNGFQAIADSTTSVLTCTYFMNPDELVIK
jgi:hypothetical protein